MKINKLIDATLINPKAAIQDYIILAEDVIKYDLRGVVVPTFALDHVREILKGSKIITSTVIDFPLGLSDTYIRFKAIEYAINHHADEIDLVINPVFINASKFYSIEDELSTIYEYFKIPIKAIVDRKLLYKVDEDGHGNGSKIGNAIEIISSMLGVTHIKTGTGYFGKATDCLVKIYTLHSTKPIKAAGGIKHYNQAIKLINAGASILGTSNHLQIIKEQDENS